MPGYFKKPEEKNQPRLIDQLHFPTGEPVDLAVWALRSRGIRCRMIPGQEPVTFRPFRDEVEGEIITVLPARVWQYQRTVYMTGEVTGRRMEASRLGLVAALAEGKSWYQLQAEDYT